jgi:hypothetical protein
MQGLRVSVVKATTLAGVLMACGTGTAEPTTRASAPAGAAAPVIAQRRARPAAQVSGRATRCRMTGAISPGARRALRTGPHSRTASHDRALRGRRCSHPVLRNETREEPWVHPWAVSSMTDSLIARL